jgi:hypothetical protein
LAVLLGVCLERQPAARMVLVAEPEGSSIALDASDDSNE